MLLGCLALISLVAPAAASAHLRSGTVAVDYRASIVAPHSAAYTAQIYQSDRALQMSIRPGHAVTVLGYLGEPMFRLDRSGLWVNVASPTSVVAGLMTKRERVVATSPRWRLQRGRRSVIWRDGRVQALPAGRERGLVERAAARRRPSERSWTGRCGGCRSRRCGHGWRRSVSRSRPSVLLLLRRAIEDARRAAVSLA